MSNLQHHDHAGDLQRKLTNRHLQLIAIGGPLEQACLWGRAKLFHWRGHQFYLSI